MLEIEKPSIQCVQQVGRPYICAKFVMEPLERGFGSTTWKFAASVCFLSCLPGAAVTRVKIDSVLHEFSTMKGVSEDVVNILS